MNVYGGSFSVRTDRRCQMVDITSKVAGEVSGNGVKDGDVLVFCPHTTAGITINENADPDVQSDLLLTLGELIPEDFNGYRHSEGNSDSHAKSSLVGCSEVVAVRGGKLVLGTWQGIYFCEFDGPRSRRVELQIRSFD